MLRKSKEQERLVIRNNSLRYDETIRKNKRLERDLKGRMAQEVRLGKENYK
jgi:hypothetical protein